MELGKANSPTTKKKILAACERAGIVLVGSYHPLAACIDETARLVLGKYGFSIAQPGLRANTLGSEYSHLGHGIEYPLNYRRGASDDTGRDGERA